MPTSALYYPWMHFQDDNWVKLALLTWDSLVRVRARDVDDKDSDLVRQVRAETNFLKEIAPSQRDLEAVSNAFAEILETSEDQIVDRFGHNPKGWPKDVATVYSAPKSNIGFRFANRRDLTWVYCGSQGTKVAEALQLQLESRGLGEGDGSWLGMQPKLASIYLAALADVIARHNLISPVTDDTRMHHAIGALDRLAGLLLDDQHAVPALENPASAYVHIVLEAVIKPERLAGVPVGKLIRFRDGHVAELAAFREHVVGLAGELREIATVENLDIAHAHLESLYRKNTKPQLDDLRRALRGLGVESAAGSLGLRVDLNAATGTIVGGMVAAGGQFAVAGAAIAMTVVPYLVGKHKGRREALSTSPVAYLLAADRRLPS